MIYQTLTYHYNYGVGLFFFQGFKSRGVVDHSQCFPSDLNSTVDTWDMVGQEDWGANINGL